MQGRQAAEIGAAVLRRVMAGSEGKLENSVGQASATGGEQNAAAPQVIAMIGVNGSGKTTTTAKLAHKMKGDGQTVIVAACDTFRAERL